MTALCSCFRSMCFPVCKRSFWSTFSGQKIWMLPQTWPYVFWPCRVTDVRLCMNIKFVMSLFHWWITNQSSCTNNSLFMDIQSLVKCLGLTAAKSFSLHSLPLLAYPHPTTSPNIFAQPRHLPLPACSLTVCPLYLEKKRKWLLCRPLNS